MYITVLLLPTHSIHIFKDVCLLLEQQIIVVVVWYLYLLLVQKNIFCFSSKETFSILYFAFMMSVSFSCHHFEELSWKKKWSISLIFHIFPFFLLLLLLYRKLYFRDNFIFHSVKASCPKLWHVHVNCKWWRCILKHESTISNNKNGENKKENIIHVYQMLKMRWQIRDERWKLLRKNEKLGDYWIKIEFSI